MMPESDQRQMLSSEGRERREDLLEKSGHTMRRANRTYQSVKKKSNPTKSLGLFTFLAYVKTLNIFHAHEANIVPPRCQRLLKNTRCMPFNCT